MVGITQILNQLNHGDPKANTELFAWVYNELRRIAAQKMASERPGHTLQPTALVNEAWLRLAAGDPPSWNSRGHFFSAAAEAMRRILVDNARRKKRGKHGGDLERVNLDEIELPFPVRSDELLAVDEALDRLQGINANAAEVVKLCYFAGLTQEQAGQHLGVSTATSERLWAFARAWLFREMKKG